jgi:hypothetical protein
MTQLQQGFTTGEMGFGVCLHGSNPGPRMSALGQKQTFAGAKRHVRFTPNSGH